MSFADKIVGLMARPGQDLVPKDDVPWYLKYGGRILGIVAAVFAIIFGLYNCIFILTMQIDSLVSGLLQVCAGMVVLMVEAPCCCMFIDFVQKVADKADAKPYWNRAAVYCLIAIPPIIICPGLASIFGSGLIFATGVVYGMMSLGKKANIDEMRNSAVAADNSRRITTTTTSRATSNLVDNAQPISITGPPAYDSNV